MMGSQLGSIVAGLTSGSSPSLDLSSLYYTVKNSGEYQQALINALPAELQKQLAEYTKQMEAGGAAYQGNIQGQGADYAAKMAQVYGPNTEAATAEKAANTQAAYAAVPGQQDAVRQALAATGGLARGNAATALMKPMVQAAQTAGNANIGVNATQAGKQQQATQTALTTVNSMNEQMFTQLFGMSKQQAQQILTNGNQTLRDQLAQLITQNTNQTNQTLNLQGVQENNAYQTAVADYAKRYNDTAGIVNDGVNGLTSAGMGGGGGGGMNFAGMLQGLMANKGDGTGQAGAM